jgi:hypothetical protein
MICMIVLSLESCKVGIFFINQEIKLSIWIDFKWKIQYGWSKAKLNMARISGEEVDWDD